MKPMTDNSMRVAQMKEKASRQEVFNEEELDVVVRSFQYAMGNFSERCLPFADFDPMDEDSEDEHVDWMCMYVTPLELSSLLSYVCLRYFLVDPAEVSSSKQLTKFTKIGLLLRALLTFSLT